MNSMIKNYMIEKEFYSAAIIENCQMPFAMLHRIKEQLSDKVRFSILSKKGQTFTEIILKVLDLQPDIIVICYDDEHDEILNFVAKLKEENVLLPILIISSKPDADAVASLMKHANVDFSSLSKFSEEKFYNSLLFFRKEHKHHYLLNLLKSENKKLWQIIKQNPVSILISEANTNAIEFVNYNFTKLTGYSLYEVIGKDPKILASGKMPKSVYSVMWETLRIGKVWKGEIQNRRKDGTYFWCYVAIAPLYNENGALTHYVAIYDDITAQIEAELQLRKKSEELKKANEHLNNNMERALKLHRHFFPITMPELENYELEAYYQPAEIIGGDFYNVVKYKNQLLFYIVDASGKGIDGAFINIFVRQKINRFLYVEHENLVELYPKDIMQFLAEEYNKENFPAEYFICLFVGVINLETHELTYSNAGIQVPPIIVDEKDCDVLTVGGLPISSAIDVNMLQYETETIPFPEAATFVVTSDGMVEEYEKEEMYGFERFCKVIRDNYYLPPNRLKERMVQEVKKFLNGKKNDDDHTFLIIQRKFPKKFSKSYVLNSTISDIQKFGDEVYETLQKYKIENHDLILFGIYEMAYNALEHGNQFDGNKKITIEFDIYDMFVKISIEDEGAGFNWQERLSKKINLLNDNERGRGIILTKKCFTSIFYNDKGNKVELIAYNNDKNGTIVE